ncbi:copper resistance protein NlpE N-terminal domain-containing protein [Galbibacter sp. EGI 63066]|uniref:copper resistance protein NlpE N-terminal domain-containing protein n=1 Tax=Galbibacter sp. EGI 63066 TaxID=2993559 RepID=UPI0022492A6A|nr:copper resistance protein NlpE N-terminal domain-containing protein [Galbibacter sp. EGI 63066]MCX2680224.1 copper resistance protein NlpE N-terminal domain-containing protein [Galbibacter sp. EGI 63066]
MNTKILTVCCLSLTFTLLGCKQKAKKETPEITDSEQVIIDSEHSSASSLDWAGTYSGVLPCADCEGIETSISINNDMTFTSKNVYLGKDDSPFETKGTFTWNDAGTTITLNTDHEGPNQYLVGENKLIKLDSDGNKITGDLASMYVLKKEMIVTDTNLTSKKWKLIKLLGKPAEEIGKAAQEPFIQFDTEKMVVSGTGGCNVFSGTYDIKEGNRIDLSKIVATLKACPDMAVETELLKALDMADNYAIKDGVLSLNRARMAPLAVFEAME